ncbi:MAG: 4,5-DOPA dioxygenase extradiol [Thiolinea sp.]
MNRRKFLAGLGLSMMPWGTGALANLKQSLPHSDTMPVLFIGHGSPMNAIEDNRFSQGWKVLGKQIPEPAAILCISAHWLTRGSFVSTASSPETIHDFGGFPQALFDTQYPAAGSPEGAELVRDLVRDKQGERTIVADESRGLDHGTWSVLVPMFPKANIPVFQLSINYYQPMEYHYQLAKQLSELRNRGVLIIGSGNIVHNLRELQQADQGYDWANEFDEAIKDRLLAGDYQSVLNYWKFGRAAELSVPTPDHYIPLLYAMGLQRPKDKVRFANEWLTKGAISMRSVIWEES